MITPKSSYLGQPLLFLNHGGPPLQKALEVSQENLAEQVNMMVISQVRIVQTLIPAMIENKWGRIFLVGASAVSQPIPGNELSNMYRTGMAQYCKTLAGDVIKDGVTVNVVSPMTVLTDRTRSTAANAAGKKAFRRKKSLPTAKLLCRRAVLVSLKNMVHWLPIYQVNMPAIAPARIGALMAATSKRSSVDKNF